MKEIKLTKNTHFIMETDGAVLQPQIDEFAKLWREAFPDNKIFFVKRDSLTIVEVNDK